MLTKSQLFADNWTMFIKSKVAWEQEPYYRFTTVSQEDIGKKGNSDAGI